MPDNVVEEAATLAAAFEEDQAALVAQVRRGPRARPVARNRGGRSHLFLACYPITPPTNP